MQQPVSAAFTGPRNVCRILVCPLYLKLVGFHTGKVSVAGGVVREKSATYRNHGDITAFKQGSGYTDEINGVTDNEQKKTRTSGSFL